MVPGTSRIAARDTVLPLGGGKDGKAPVFIAKDTLVMFHFYGLHQRKDIWGDDAAEFRPERWEDRKSSWVILLA